LSPARSASPEQNLLAGSHHNHTSRQAPSHEHPFYLSLSLLTISLSLPPSPVARLFFTSPPLPRAPLQKDSHTDTATARAPLLHQRHHYTTGPGRGPHKSGRDKATKDAAAAVLPPCLQPASHRPGALKVREPRLFPPSCLPSRFLSARPPAPGPSKHAVALQRRSRGEARDAVT
jgi:hypothetical protein